MDTTKIDLDGILKRILSSTQPDAKKAELIGEVHGLMWARRSSDGGMPPEGFETPEPGEPHRGPDQYTLVDIIRHGGLTEARLEALGAFGDLIRNVYEDEYVRGFLAAAQAAYAGVESGLACMQAMKDLVVI